ncbi:MAG: OmpA family protein [Paludibacteraceae bacterium]
MKLKSFFLTVLVAATQLIFAQNADNKFAISLYGGINQYKGELGNGLSDFDQLNPLGALSLSTYVSRSFDLGIQGSYGNYGFKNDIAKFSGNKYEGFMYLDYKLANGYLFSEKAIISPFLTAGIGLAGYSGNRINDFPMDLITPIGAGLKFNISQRFGIVYRFLYAFTNHDEHDLIPMKGRSDHFAEHLLGITLALGAPKDTDKDGVPDKKDNCPDTPQGVVVDNFGCPVDGDGDGIADYLDKCPDVAGLAKFDGCPDSDGDGVQDSMDKCPNTPKGVAVDSRGCPVDTDKDGIADYLDKCPNVAGTAKFDGCPDSDGDGIQDSMDKCPDVAGLPEFEGCPDTDGDGIPDNLDKCPKVPGIAANKGCPEVQKEVTAIFKQALQGIQFDVSKATIKPTSYGILDKVVKVMTDNPAYNLQINGYTDSQGNDEYNKKLSDDRANAVKQYLIDKGIDGSRLAAQGFGESDPIASNATSKGRYFNRRVEFKVLF